MQFLPSRYRYHSLVPPTSWSSHSKSQNLSVLLLLAFSILYLVAFLTTRTLSQQDPTSYFFDPVKGYKTVYSLFRQEQAERFIGQVSHGAPVTKWDPKQSSKTLCVGVASVARRETRYFRAAVGSLLQGLDPQERARIYLVLFIAHTDPTVHPAFSEPWLYSAADEVLLYNKSLPAAQIDYLRQLESEKKGFYDKPLFDYGYLLKACLDSSASHMALFEDDIIAMDGWFHRTENALEEMENRVEQDDTLADPLYLRLFYTEKYLGWNRERWLTYLSWSLFLAFALTAMLAIVWRFVPCRPVKDLYTRPNALVLYCVCLPLTISLFFMAGSITTLSLPHGLSQMDNFGCCSQGLVFSRPMAEKLVGWYEEKRAGYVDVLTEEYGNEFGNTRWALMPSVIQHVGGKTSKDDGLSGMSRGARSVAETIWNFEFERFDAGALRLEHDLAVGGGGPKM